MANKDWPGGRRAGQPVPSPEVAPLFCVLLFWGPFVFHEPGAKTIIGFFGWGPNSSLVEGYVLAGHPVARALVFFILFGKSSPDQKRRLLFSHGHWASEVRKLPLLAEDPVAPQVEAREHGAILTSSW